MRDFSKAFELAQTLANCAYSKVVTQQRIISAMAPEDPALPYAHAVLRQLEQSASLAAIGQILSHPTGEAPSQVVMAAPQSSDRPLYGDDPTV